jgi:N,N'-diacetylchitobiose transport system permease protein
LSTITPAAPTPVAPSVTVMERRRSGRGRLFRAVGWNALGLLVFVVMVFPVYWMIATAFKPGRDIQDYTPHWFPVPATLHNFTDAIHRPFFWTDVKNSLIIVSCVVVLSLAVAFLAALALSRFKFRGRAAFIVLIISVQMIPLTALIIPLYITLSRVHQVNTLSGVVVMYLTFVLPFTVWTLRGFMLGVPRELEEAAMVDGATRFGFIQAWNEFIIAYVFLHDAEKQTLTVWLASFTNLHGTDWGPLMAGATLTALPVVVFFVLIQRKIMFGLTAGAVRG